MQLADGLHPTPRGVKEIVRRILPLVELELARARP
jgi:lysophospholipase L1-like esterase